MKQQPSVTQNMHQVVARKLIKRRSGTVGTRAAQPFLLYCVDHFRGLPRVRGIIIQSVLRYLLCLL